MQSPATPPLIDSPKRQLATRIVRKLVDSGFTAYFAGGCVRDQLLGRPPKDYDVATDATPEQVRSIFGPRRTLAIGASFGVISVLGESIKHEGQVDVATFRKDGLYVDGRRPTEVAYSSPEEDAQRRDFTINGMFFDPLAERIIDFVGGQRDLADGVIRAIGSPRDRFEEDKLRLLRGIRFASEYGLKIEPGTLQAITELASQIHVVSGERIAAEMTRSLLGSHPDSAVRLLQTSGLLAALLPEVAKVWFEKTALPDERNWGQVLPALVASAQPGGLGAAMAALLLPIRWGSQAQPTTIDLKFAGKYIGGVASRWRLSNDVRDSSTAALAWFPTLLKADQLPWSEVQPFLVHIHCPAAMAVAKACAETFDSLSQSGLALCERKLALPLEELNPPPLLTGDQLRERGWQPGPHFKSVLDQVRAAQLNGELTTNQQAIDHARHVFDSLKDT